MQGKSAPESVRPPKVKEYPISCFKTLQNYMETVEWIEEWYRVQCDGDWEHEYGVKIQTLDNPGWDVRIDLFGTDLEDLSISWTLNE